MTPGRTLRRTVAEARAEASRGYVAAIAARNDRAQQRLSQRTRYRQLCKEAGEAARLSMQAGRGVDAYLAAQMAAHYGRLAMGETEVIPLI